MTDHDRAKALFLAALELPAADRQRFVAEASGTDAQLRAEVESLLGFHDENGDEAGAEDGAPDDNRAFTPGSIFADRYRMISRIGRGGMGDVWRADDLVLETPVALKLLHSTTADSRARIANEVRLARQITHSAICRVFDVGESDGTLFLSMELVQGQDLASLLRLAGRLPSEKVIDIAEQLCAGLAAAHARGVLHRDLKPANVLIDDRGKARITDFGIAIPRTDSQRHTIIGTPEYMSPEQRSRNAPLTERTDIYALGLVLYELLAGHHPFENLGPGHAIRKPSTLVPDVDPQLERVILQAISDDPQQRPASATAMSASLRTKVPAITPASRRRVLTVAAVAAAILVVSAVTTLVLRRGTVLNEQDTIVVADFANSTGEPVFDGAMKVALSVALEQSPFLKVFGDERVRETLRLMERPPDTTITREIAREIAVRERLKATLAGTIARLGSNYVVTLEAMNAETGDVMAREQVEAGSQEKVLGALGEIAARLRERLGESLASVKKFDVGLPEATTASLEALKAYALGLEDGRLNPTRDAIAHLKRAIELDPNFAMAHAMLSGLYANMGQSALAPAHSQRAFELRDRVSERERFYISWRYYRDAAQAWDKGLELARSWAATYPRESPAFNSLGYAGVTLGQYESSIAPLREAIRLDPQNFAPPENLAVALVALNRLDEAKTVLREARARQRFFFAQARVSFLIAFLENDVETRQQILKEALGQRDPTNAANWEARASAFGGQMTKAHDQFREAIRMVQANRLAEIAAHFTAQDAESHAVIGECDQARKETAEALALSRDNFTLERGSRVLAYCNAPADAQRLTSELAERLPDATLTIRVHRPITAGILALRRGDPVLALQVLEDVRPYDDVPSAEFWPAFLRGEAYVQLKDGTRAEAEFRHVLDHRGAAPDGVLYPLAHLGLARAAVLTSSADARQRYDEFFAFWRYADPDLEPIADARREYSALR